MESTSELSFLRVRIECSTRAILMRMNVGILSSSRSTNPVIRPSPNMLIGTSSLEGLPLDIMV